MGSADDTDALREERLHLAELTETAEDLYDNAPCGYLSTTPEGHVVRINATLLRWLGYEHDQVVGRMRFADLLTVGGKMYHETHFAPLLFLQGAVHSVALEIRTADRRRLAVLVDAVVKKAPDDAPSLVRIMVVDAADRRAYEDELLRARRQADLERDRLQHLATTLQRTLLPPALPGVPGLDIAAYYHSASVEEIGGDFYDLFPMGNGRWCFLLGDVQGKDPEAMSVTGLTRHLVRLLAREGHGVESVLGRLNAAMAEEGAEAVAVGGESAQPRFLSLVYGELEPDQKKGGARCTIASAGHPPPLKLSPRGEVVPVVESQMLLGIDEGTEFMAFPFCLEPGESLLCVTDGVTERRSGQRQLDDDDGLADILAGCVGMGAMAVAERVRQAAHDFGPEPVEDDLAILVLHAVVG